MAATWFSAPAPVARRVRAYFAPVNRAAQTPVLFDPSQQGRFSLDAPPAPWISLGWIQDFARKPASKTSPLLTGIPAAPLEQVRETLAGASKSSVPELDQVDHGAGDRLAAYEPACAGERRGSGSGWSAGDCRQLLRRAVRRQHPSLLASTDAAKFTAGSIVAVDVDYTGQTGFVGSPVAGAYVRQALTDVDYIRRVTFNVALVSQVSSTGLTLAEPLPGGAPAAGAKAAGGYWICGSRRRQLLPGVVGAVRDAGQPGRKNLLPLSKAADHDRRGGSSYLRSTARIKTGSRGCCSKDSFWRCRSPIRWMASGWSVTAAFCRRPMRLM